MARCLFFFSLRGLLGEQKKGLGRHAGVLETKILGGIGKPFIR